MSVRKDTPTLCGEALGRSLATLIVAWFVLRWGWTAAAWFVGIEAGGLLGVLAVRAWRH